MPIRSYRTAFILLFAALLVVTTLAVGFNAYRRASEVSLGLSSDIITQMAERTGDRTVQILENAYTYLETDALAVPKSDLIRHQDQIFKLFWRQLELDPQLQSIYLATPDGGFLQVRAQPQLVTRIIERSGERPREQLIYRDRGYQPIAHINGGGLFDPRNRAWYVGALAAQGNVTWSSVYRFSTVDKPGVTASKAILDPDGRPLMVLGVDIALEGLSELLAEQPMAKGAVAMIVDEKDQLVAYPYRLKLKPRTKDAPPDALPTIAELDNPAMVRAYEAFRPSDADGRDIEASATQAGFRTTRADGVDYISQMHHFPSHWTDGWRLFVVVPETSLLTTAGRLLSESAVISVIILAVAVALVSWLGMRLFSPLRKLVHNTELIKAMRFSEIRPVRSRFREIQAMDAAICGVKQSLETLEKFVPSHVVRELMELGSEAKPGGEVVKLTIFCGGMAQFGTLCRTLPPEEITRILTGQIDRFTRILLRQGGTVDNYLGESILAFWGAPSPVEDGPVRACLSILQCLEAEAELAHAHPNVDPGLTGNLFALHAGPAIVGNIGSQHRLAYTAIGDNVELGWRLKQLNRLYGTKAILSGAVREAIGEKFWLRHLDRLPIGEGAGELELYELLGERDRPLAADIQLYTQAYEQALDTMLEGRWEEADEGFAELQAQRPEDRALRLMRRRCATQSKRLCLVDSEVDSLADLAATL